MRRTLSGLLIVGLLLSLGGMRGHGEEPKTVSDLMRKKLVNAQKVLEGIALGNFKEVAAHGDELMFLSKEAEWKVYKTTQYELYSNEFRRAVDTMVQKAREKNLDGVTLAYLDLTMSCVKCHKYVREERKV
jgi:hypothetical protein